VKRVPTPVVVSAAVFMLCAALPSAVRAQAIGRLTGSVKDIAGRPIRTAEISATTSGSRAIELKAKVDQKGQWTILGLRGGRWDVTASARGFQPMTVSVQVAVLQGGFPVDFVLLGVPTPTPLDGVDTVQLQTDLRKAASLMSDERWDEALAEYRAILARVPQLDSVNLAIGQALRMKKDYAGAEAAYGAILKRDAQNQKAILEVGRTQHEAGDQAAAVATLQRVLAIDELTDEASEARTLLAEIRK
jgi:tetratricopeptide (TPR) repeat protein